MPTENERKYVLNLDFIEEFETLRETLGGTLWGPVCMKQAYIFGNEDWNLRVRQEVIGDEEPVSIMCLKYDVGERVVEIEKEVSTRDFDDLWKQTERRLAKKRYKLRSDEQGSMWDVDLFENENGDVYFAQAEYEMPESQDKPAFIPFVIRKYLLYAVPKSEQFTFSSYNLADPTQASAIYEAVCREVEAEVVE